MNEEEEYIQQLQQLQQLQKEQEQPYNQPSSYSTISNFQKEDNIIKWQLKFDDILQHLDHLLRGHKIEFDKNGNRKWIESKNEKDITLNDYGVSIVMRIITGYVNPNTVLSNLSEEQIAQIMLSFGNELIDAFFLEYEIMGLNTEQKIKKFPMLYEQMVDIVYITLNRALNGDERRLSHSSINISQTGSINTDNNSYPLHIEKKQGFISRMTRGKTYT